MYILFYFPENILCMSGENESVAGQSGRGNVPGVQIVRENVREGRCPTLGCLDPCQLPSRVDS